MHDVLVAAAVAALLCLAVFGAVAALARYYTHVQPATLDRIPSRRIEVRLDSEVVLPHGSRYTLYDEASGGQQVAATYNGPSNIDPARRWWLVQE